MIRTIHYNRHLCTPLNNSTTMALMTVNEVIAYSFNRSVAETQIRAEDIDVAEWKYIRPILTNEFYEAVIASPASSDYTTLMKFIKPCLAYFTKYKVVNTMSLELSSRGGFQLNADTATPISDQQRYDYQAETLDSAVTLGSMLLNHILDEDYSLYSGVTGTAYQNIGGFLVEKSQEPFTGTTPSTPSVSGDGVRLYVDSGTIYLQTKIAGIWTNTGTSWDV